MSDTEFAALKKRVEELESEVAKLTAHTPKPLFGCIAPRAFLGTKACTHRSECAFLNCPVREQYG